MLRVIRAVPRGRRRFGSYSLSLSLSLYLSIYASPSPLPLVPSTLSPEEVRLHEFLRSSTRVVPTKIQEILPIKDHAKSHPAT